MAIVKLTIDGKEVQVEAGTNLIEAAKLACSMVPHYCYHPGLTPDGNCRMCLVQVEKMPKPVIACRTGAAEGMVVHTKSPEVVKMRETVMEFLLINHPLDCPTCDQAGECKLQDYYMDYDAKPSRYKEEKVHKDKMVDLGAGVMLDEERCIVCTRCVRFCQEVPKKEELFVQARGNHSMVATFPGKKMTSVYAGNTVDVCPVGALTSKDFRYKKRVWYLSHTESICPGCSRGCNISVHHEDNTVYRLKPTFNPDVNQYWMCDIGRHDYKFINENRRLKPTILTHSKQVETTYEEAREHLINQFKLYESNQVAFVASARESNEEIDAFVDFAKSVAGAKEVYFSKNDPENPYSDDILITADKNPNSAHIAKLELSPLSKIPASVKAVIIQRDLSAKDEKFIREKKITVAALFATNVTTLDDLAHTIFPIPTYAEQDGHFTNVKELVQKFKRALRLRGEAKLISIYMSDLKEALLSRKMAKTA